MRGLTILLVIILLLALAAYIMSKRTPTLSIVLGTLSALLAVLLIGGFMNWIPTF